MKHILMLLSITLTIGVNAQTKAVYKPYNSIVELKGTSYVIATKNNWNKFSAPDEKSMLFINTLNGDTNRVQLSASGYYTEFKQIKLDSLDINLVIATDRTVDLNNKSGINWDDPEQLFAISTDGKVKTQLTENGFFVNTWTVNSQTGYLVVSGYLELNNNNKFDHVEKNELLIFDLKTLKLLRRI